MTRRERVRNALLFQDTDIVPYAVTFTRAAEEKLAAHYGDPGFHSRIGDHLSRFSHRKRAPWTTLEPGFERDEWGVIWNRTVDKDIGVASNRVVSERSVGGLDLPDPRAWGLDVAYREWIGANEEVFRIESVGFSLFERAWALRGMEQLLIDMVESPGFVEELFDAIVEVNMRHLEVALVQDIDCVLFGDDWGSQTGLIMGPGVWRELIKPRVAKMYARVREAGKFVAIQSCGDVRAILPDLVEVGLNLFNPFQPEVMTPEETKEAYRGKLAFYGGISVQNLLPHGTPDEVRRETKRLLETLGKGGGYIASPSHDVPSDVPAENMAAMIEAMMGQGEG